jgi:hypothetical protein
MTNELERRLEALQRRLNADRPAGTMAHGVLLCVVIHGALPPGWPLFAAAGEHEWIRSEGEDLDQFADRAVAGARDARENLLVIGGLPNSQLQHDAAMIAYDRWLETDASAPPPCEPSPGMPSAVMAELARRERSP